MRRVNKRKKREEGKTDTIERNTKDKERVLKRTRRKKKRKRKR